MALTGRVATTAACILVLLALADAAGAANPSPAPAPAPDCTEALIGLADCLDYVMPGSKSARPPKACCTEVKTAVGTPATVKCLCAALDAKTTPIPINMTRVLALPTACGQSASVLSKCHGEHRAFSHLFYNLLVLGLPVWLEPASIFYTKKQDLLVPLGSLSFLSVHM